ncbi:hypothetical protein [Colidextribacter sp. OB.20]|uniref:hypothetical protein n=1 Tax=Colidextribacter sp. OB.20 TaxID=2304568 RepID=UPI001371EBB4|nr:hypothetical protein [Colidextribacter sp. OB.20]
MEERMSMRGGGWLSVCQEGPRVHMEAERPADGKGLYKVWLRGDQGGRLLLGTMAPEDGLLRLRRTLSVSALERAGCWPQFRAEAPLAFPFTPQHTEKWYCEQHPERLLTDPVLRGQVPGPMLCLREGEGFSLSAPLRADRPFPMPALFCLARPERREGRLYLVWRFGRRGRPIPPGSTGTP